MSLPPSADELTALRTAQLADLIADQVYPGSDPRRLRREDNALLMANGLDTELAVIAVLASVVGRRGVTADSLRSALARRPRIRRRRFILRLLDDLAAGTASVLEHAYLDRVERAHGLPPATRQLARRTTDGLLYRDVAYEPFGLVVGLDGRLGHDSWNGLGRVPTATSTTWRCTVQSPPGCAGSRSSVRRVAPRSGSGRSSTPAVGPARRTRAARAAN